jgi:hypothetical protein
MNFEDMVVRVLEEKRTGAIAAMVAGRLSNFPEYTSLAGEIRGLSFAIEAVKDLADQMRENDDR